ncbi:MAG: hypothetical protein RIT04_208 [Candidatus Parcubacteria bacterium]|jgi:hypothetical protein
MSKKSLTIIILIALAIVGVIWYFMFVRQTVTPGIGAGNTATTTGFFPLNSGGVPAGQGSGKGGNGTGNSTTTPVVIKVPTLRHIYTTPVGGMVASTTASSTVLRFIDRGTGRVYEANSLTEDIRILSNTTINRVYESLWNKNATAFVIQYMKSDSDAITTFYTELRSTNVATASSTATSTPTLSTTPYELRGKMLSPNITEIAINPKRDKIFEFSNENGLGVGYAASLDEKVRLKLFDIPATQMNVEWPEENTIALTTKGTASGPGFLYLFDIKKASMKKVLGGFAGLSTSVNRSGTKVLYSRTVAQGLRSSIYDIKTGTTQDLVFATLPEKCVWGNVHTEDLYCAVPSQFPPDDARYPDAWYQGKVSFADAIWYINAETGEVHQLADLYTISNKQIDATHLTLDPKENFLYFIDKRDLSLWSFDLTQ